MTGKRLNQNRRLANLVIFAAALSLVVAGFAWRFSSGGGIQDWLGVGPEGHQHMAEGFSSPLLGTNESWAQTFSQAGLFAYGCHPHPFMNGSVRVTSSNATARSGTVGISMRNLSFEPAYVEVTPGTVVRWTNEDPVQHNVVQVATTNDAPGLAWWEAALVGAALLAAVLLIATKFTRRPGPTNRNANQSNGSQEGLAENHTDGRATGEPKLEHQEGSSRRRT